MNLDKLLHPRIKTALAAFERGVPRSSDGLDGDQQSSWSRLANSHISAVTFVVMALMTISVLAFAGPQDLTVGTWFGGSGLAIILLGIERRRAGWIRQLRRIVGISQSDTAWLSPAERAYCQAMLQLAVAGTIGRVGKEQIGRLLNDLLDSHYRVCRRRCEIQSSLCDSVDVKQIYRERESIGEKLACVADLPAGESFQLGLAQCEERIRRRLSADPLLARTYAREQLIYHTLSNFAESLARLKTATTEAGFSEPYIIHRIIAEINQQTRSIEDAEKELTRLGAARCGNTVMLDAPVN